MMRMPPPTIAAAPPEPAPGAGFRARPATVLQVLPALGAEGGVERGTIEVAEAIMAAGGRAVVASAGGPRAQDLTRLGGVHVTLPLASKFPAVVWANARRLSNVIREHGIDLVHARSRAPAWSAWLAAQRTGTPFITTFHGTYGARTALKRAYNEVMTRGERIIAISRFIARHVERVYGVDPARLCIIPRGVDTTLFDPAAVPPGRVAALRRQWGVAEGVPLVLLPGRLTRWKGQLVLVEAMARLNRTDVAAVLLGSDQGRTGYRREVQAAIAARNLGSVVHMVEHCDDMAAALLAAHVVVSASTDPEAFGRIAIEAQAMGRPVIASDHGGARETVAPGISGWRIPPGDAGALAATLAGALATSTAARDRMGAAGLARVRADFTKEIMCARTLDVYDEVLRERASG